MTAPKAPAGAIYDIGYQHYDGKRLGRAGAVRALYWEGLRSVFGIGRGIRAKIPPIALVAMMIVPAVVQSAVEGFAGGLVQIFTHAGYFRTTVWIFGLFCAFQAPELVTGDHQHRVLALYFSRAVRRGDYVLARLGALATALFLVGLLPHLILLFGRWFSATDTVESIRESATLVLQILAAALAIAVLLAVVSLTLAALIKRRPLATAAILGLFLVASAFVTPLVMSRPSQMRHLVLASPMLVGDGLTAWIFDLAAVQSKVIQESDESTPVTDSAAMGGGPRPAPRQSRQARRASRRSGSGPVRAADLPGWAYLAALLGFVALSGVVLTLRYRSVEI